MRKFSPYLLSFFSVFLIFFQSFNIYAASDALDLFYKNTRVFSADFNQEVKDKEGESLVKSTGQLIIGRPDKFVMIYTYPDEQQYISDGKILWIYDKDLEQVTIKKFDADLKKSPVLILSGNKSMRALYDIKESINYDKPEQDIFILTPKPDQSSDSGSQFAKIELIFSNKILSQLKMSDHFDHITSLTLNNQKINQDIDDATFKFKIPEGIDVLDNSF